MGIDLSKLAEGLALTGSEGASPPEKSEAFEYKAAVSSGLIKGDVILKIDAEALIIVAPLDALSLPYFEILGINAEDYTVSIQSLSGNFIIKKLGSFYDSFCGELLEAYNKKVLKALFVKENAVFETKGAYKFTENGKMSISSGVIKVFSSCVCILSPDLLSRRIPFCFVSEKNSADYALELTLESGESYILSKLGHDFSPLEKCIDTQMRNQRDKAVAAIKELDNTLNAAATLKIASMMLEGKAVPFSSIYGVSDSFVNSLGAKINESRSAEYFAMLLEMTDLGEICIGMKKNESTSGDGGDYVLWLIVPGRNKKSAAVEFAVDMGDSAATFIYNFTCPFEEFAKKLSRALEAVEFKREVISMPDIELSSPDNTDYLMASERTEALKFARKAYKTKIIHNSGWKAAVEENLN